MGVHLLYDRMEKRKGGILKWIIIEIHFVINDHVILLLIYTNWRRLLMKKAIAYMIWLENE